MRVRDLLVYFSKFIIVLLQNSVSGVAGGG